MSDLRMSDLRMSDLQEEVSRQPWRGFASDNYAGVHPQILAALTRVNSGHQVAYGDDSITAELDERMATLFGRPVGILSGVLTEPVPISLRCRRS